MRDGTCKFPCGRTVFDMHEFVPLSILAAAENIAGC